MKKMLPLTKEELKIHQDSRNCYICWNRILQKLARSENYWKVSYHCFIKVNIENRKIDKEAQNLMKFHWEEFNETLLPEKE